MTKTEKLLTLLQSGQNLTAKEISRATKLSNPGEAIRQLRNQGYCIYTNKNGYRLGKPTKAMVQYVALNAGNTVFDAR